MLKLQVEANEIWGSVTLLALGKVSLLSLGLEKWLNTLKFLGLYISTMFFQIELPRDSMIVGRNRGHVTSRAKRVKYKAEVEAILSLSRGVIHLKEHS